MGRGEKSTGGNSLGGKGVSKLLTGGATPPFSFHRGEIHGKLTSKIVGTDAKKID